MDTPFVSNMAEALIGSEIIKLATQINEKISDGQKIHNLTIGDFNPDIFSFRRIKLAPIIILVGYIGMIVSIFYND